MLAVAQVQPETRRENSMDLETGEIYDIESLEALTTIEDKLGRRLVPLSEPQAKELRRMSNRERKRLLAGGPCPCGSGKSFKKCCWKKYK